MELSFPEIILIVAIALIVLGPKELVKTSEQLGRWIGKLRTQFNNMKVMFTEEVMMQEERKKLEEALNEKIDLKDKPESKDKPDTKDKSDG